MAPQGVNLPLAFTGQEAIWQKVFKEKFNMSISDLDDFFGGPAFLTWSPFSGNVPAALKYIFPSAKITRLGNWFSVKSDPKWTCTYLHDATDPLFVEIGKAFVEQQLQEYGRSSHIYNCDTFDENTPSVDDPEYISSLGATIFKGMQSGDNDAIWLMQGWLFSYDPFWRPPQMKALLHSVPVGNLLVLDLFAEVKPIWITSEQFYGVPYIWSMLHNFAGNIEMYGILDVVASGPIEARTSVNSTMHNKIDVKVWVDLYLILSARSRSKHGCFGWCNFNPTVGKHSLLSFSPPKLPLPSQNHTCNQINACFRDIDAVADSQKGVKENGRIKKLPGQPFVKFSQFGGYVTLDKLSGSAFYYYFVEAHQSKETLPLLLWLNGGPGCSSLAYGTMQESGPFRVNSDGKTLHQNRYSWNYAAKCFVLGVSSWNKAAYDVNKVYDFSSSDNLTAECNSIQLLISSPLIIAMSFKFFLLLLLLQCISLKKSSLVSSISGVNCKLSFSPATPMAQPAVAILSQEPRNLWKQSYGKLGLQGDARILLPIGVNDTVIPI
ncbi:hypothetical protein KIW84_014084 [Lathyrus oleraceus]|uniref:Alpha-N-acetylglucosaminidase tim-barrel domain-containing protein n=1 Tax=Pisum sativum TaxID=3888 RepID=A0A9D5GYN9_PEA|nr:hypothetical protein KIW84_014084 [Pisum sativum]